MRKGKRQEPAAEAMRSDSRGRPAAEDRPEDGVSGPPGSRDSRPAPLRQFLLGQETVFRQFDRALKENRLAHAFLLLGPKGCGRTRLALALAQQLLCEREASPCGDCPGCRRVARLIHPDLHWVFPATREELQDPASLAVVLEAYGSDPYHVFERNRAAGIGIDRVRELKEELAKARVEADRRVAILSGAERMTEQAAQAALKLVEEPPPQTILFLTAEDSAQLLPTLVSRCQRFALRLLPREEVARILRDRLGEGPEEARLLAALGGGALGRSLEMRAGDLIPFRDSVLEAFAVGGRGLPLSEVESRVQALERSGALESPGRVAELLLLWYQDLLAARCGLPEEERVHLDRAAESSRLGPALEVEEIGRRVRIVEEMTRAIAQNVNPGLALHAALSRTGALPGEPGYLL